MPDLMKKPHTEKGMVLLTIRGPSENKRQAVFELKKLEPLGFFIDSQEKTDWREFFPEIEERGEGGAALFGARYKEGLTQVQLSAATGIPQRHLSEMENGKRPIGKETAKKLGNALGVSYKVFL